MDSVSQVVLGACIGTAVLGRRIGVRKAAITGGLLATLPDLDIFWPNDDPVDRFVSHRSATHSLITHTLVTPLLAEGLRRLYAALKDDRLRVYVAVFLCLTTHALLDSFTIYGTQLFWPIWPEPLGLGSIFIIDPLYTLPLLFVTLWALLRNQWSPRFAKSLVWAFVLSSAYLGWTVIAQYVVEDRSRQILAASGKDFDKLIATPTPFNSLFWHTIALDGNKYHNLYVPVFAADDKVVVDVYQRWPDSLACWLGKATREDGVTRTLSKFSKDFYLVDIVDGEVIFSDLRMGLVHAFAFTFAVAEVVENEIRPVAPRHINGVRQYPGDLEWLWAGIRGQKTIRPVEIAKFRDIPVNHAAVTPGAKARKC
jgi:inner membrane protein